MRRFVFLLILLGSTFGFLHAQAKTQPAPASGIHWGAFDVTGSIRVRAEAWDWFSTPAADGTYGFAASTLRFGIGQKHHKFDWQVEIEQPTLLGLPNDATAPAPQGQLGLGPTYFASNGQNAAFIFLKQGFIRIKGVGGESNSIKLGRFEFVDGMETTPKNAVLTTLKRERISNRLLGNFGFSHVMRSFDGGQAVFEGKPGNFTFMAGRATQGVFNVDGMPEVDADVLYGAYTRHTSKAYNGEFRIFGLHYHDGRTLVTKTDNRSLAARKADLLNIRITTLGGNLVQTVPAGKGTFDLLGWAAGQFGDWGNLQHRAWAYAFEAGYQHKIRHFDPWLRVGYAQSSGDPNSSDGTHETFFQVLPTPRGYARFPFFNLMNNQDLFSELIVRPHSKVNLRFDVHDLHLSNSKDLWYSGGGAYEENTFGYAGRPSGNFRHLATLYDISADVQWTKRVSTTAYFAYADGSDVITKIYPQRPSARFGYLEWNYRF